MSHVKIMLFVLRNKKDANATGTYKLMGDSLRQNPDHISYKFTPDKLKEKLMSGSYATVHVHN